ncbi:MAG: hypothetical protein JW749_09565 [Sedimentisphaerales bacterium]|nr:hypothetical protein [Sedimentisphaerales bacterium]
MRKGKIILLVIVVMGILPRLASGSADFDENLIVDLNDFSMFVDYWLYDYDDNQQCELWDLDDNDQIDLYDLDIMAEYWLADYDFESFSDFAEYWRKTVDYRFMDTRFDLAASGLVDFGDFSALAAEWLVPISCCDDNSFPDPTDSDNWEDITFTGIVEGCAADTCWIWGDDYSDPCWDGCANVILKACEETPDLGYTCAYNYWFNIGERVGLCVYLCGRNNFQVLKNTGRCRFIYTRHRTRDMPPQDPECDPWDCDEDCDQGTLGYYNWQVVVYCPSCSPEYRKVGICRQSLTKPSYNWGWQSSEGEPGPCKYHWWPYP